jgi:hypothetical protein
VRPLVALFKPFVSSKFYQKWALDFDESEEFTEQSDAERYFHASGCGRAGFILMGAATCVISTGIALGLGVFVIIEMAVGRMFEVSFGLLGLMIIGACLQAFAQMPRSGIMKITTAAGYLIKARTFLNKWMTRLFFFYIKFLCTSTINTLINIFFSEAIPYPCGGQCMTASYHTDGLDRILNFSITCWNYNDPRHAADIEDERLTRVQGESISKNVPYIRMSAFRRAVYVPNAIAFVIFFFGYPSLLQYFADIAHMFIVKMSGSSTPTNEDYEMCKSRFPTSFAAIIDEFSADGVNYVGLFTWLELLSPVIKMMATHIHWGFEILLVVFHIILGIIYFIVDPFPKPRDRIFRVISNFGPAFSAFLSILPHLGVNLPEIQNWIVIAIILLLILVAPIILWILCRRKRTADPENELESEESESSPSLPTHNELRIIERFNLMASVRLVGVLTVFLSLAGFAYGWFYGVTFAHGNGRLKDVSHGRDQHFC